MKCRFRGAEGLGGGAANLACLLVWFRLCKANKRKSKSKKRKENSCEKERKKERKTERKNERKKKRKKKQRNSKETAKRKRTSAGGMFAWLETFALGNSP